MDKRILVVDDEVDLATTYERLLRRQGYRVLSVGSREAGLLAVEAEPLRLVITGLRLPDGDGLDIVRAARALAAPPPVLVATVLASHRTQEACLAAGASAFLPKPFSAATFSNMVRGLLEALGTSRLPRRYDQLVVRHEASYAASPAPFRPTTPFQARRSYAIGFRNPQGLAWDRAGRMFAADLVTGPHDEIKQIVRGGNYGWPAVSGLARDPRYRDPLIESAGAIWKPSGIAVRGDTLYVAALLGRQLVRIRLAPVSRMWSGPWPTQRRDPHVALRRQPFCGRLHRNLPRLPCPLVCAHLVSSPDFLDGFS